MSEALHMYMIKTFGFTVPAVRLVSDQSGGLTQVDLQIDMDGAYEVTIDWGDGNEDTVSGTGTTYTHNYGSTSIFNIRVYGRIDKMTKFYTSAGQGTISGNIATFKPCVSLTYLNLHNTSVDGDIANLSGLTSLTTLNLYNTSVDGDIANLSGLTSLTYLNLYNTSVDGDIANLSGLTSLTTLYLHNTSVDGDIADLNTLTALNYLYLYGTSIDTYTTCTLPDWEGTIIKIYDLGLSQTEVDNFLCDLDTADGNPGNGILNISGTNSAPSATGLACESNLEGKGWTVTVTGE